MIRGQGTIDRRSSQRHPLHDLGRVGTLGRSVGALIGVPFDSGYLPG